MVEFLKCMLNFAFLTHNNNNTTEFSVEAIVQMTVLEDTKH